MDQADVARTYLTHLIDNLTGKSDPALRPFIDRLSAVDTDTIQSSSAARLDHPSMNILDEALAVASADDPLCTWAIEAARALNWGLVYGDGGMDQRLADGMLACQAVGTYGCFASDNVAAGQFLLTPGIHYALHTHKAPEIYYCVSGSIDIQHGVDTDPFILTAGNYSVTPSGLVHALTTNEEPALLLYVWIDHLREPIWIWEQDEAGRWHRQCWRKKPGESWRISETQPVTDEMIAAAHP